MSGVSKKFKKDLEESIKKSSKVFITGHNGPDYDCLGSALGLSVLSRRFDKKHAIVVDENDLEIDPTMKKILDENKRKYHIINLEQLRRKVDENSLLILSDVNKGYLTPVVKDLDRFKRKIIIDHHEPDKNTITSSASYIDPSISSASEIVTQILNCSKTKYSSEIANYLLAGIILDTKRFVKNTTHFTLDIAEKLMRNGADSDYVNSLFLTDFADDGISELLIHEPGNTIAQEYHQPHLFITRNVTFTINRINPNMVYRKVELARAADKMLKYSLVDASFVFGRLADDSIAICARSKSDVDVGHIMGMLENGGGNPENAGGIVTDKDIFEVEQMLMNYTSLGLPSELSKELVKVKEIGTNKRKR